MQKNKVRVTKNPMPKQSNKHVLLSVVYGKMQTPLRLGITANNSAINPISETLFCLVTATPSMPAIMPMS
jgi:hypothetical protein